MFFGAFLAEDIIIRDELCSIYGFGFCPCGFWLWPACYRISDSFWGGLLVRCLTNLDVLPPHKCRRTCFLRTWSFASIPHREAEALLGKHHLLLFYQPWSRLNWFGNLSWDFRCSLRIFPNFLRLTSKPFQLSRIDSLCFFSPHSKNWLIFPDSDCSLRTFLILADWFFSFLDFVESIHLNFSGSADLSLLVFSFGLICPCGFIRLWGVDFSVSLRPWSWFYLSCLFVAVSPCRSLALRKHWTARAAGYIQVVPIVGQGSFAGWFRANNLFLASNL